MSQTSATLGHISHCEVIECLCASNPEISGANSATTKCFHLQAPVPQVFGHNRASTGTVTRSSVRVLGRSVGAGRVAVRFHSSKFTSGIGRSGFLYTNFHTSSFSSATCCSDISEVHTISGNGEMKNAIVWFRKV